MVKVGDEIEVKVLRVDRERPQDRPVAQEGRSGASEDEDGEDEPRPDRLRRPPCRAQPELKGGLGGGGPLFSLGGGATSEPEGE